MYALRLRAPSPARVALPTPIIDSEAQAAEAAAMAEAEEQSLQALFPDGSAGKLCPAASAIAAAPAA